MVTRGKKIQQVRSQQLTTFRRWQVLEESDIDMEEEYLIGERWKPGMPKYEAARGQLKH
jgi:hypothetical protein